MAARTRFEIEQEAQAFLSSLVESSDDSIIGESLGGIITTWNKGAEKLFGYTPEEIIGQPVRTLIPPDKYAEEEIIFARMRRGERSQHIETVRLTKDGRRLDVLLTVSPVRDKKGRLIGASKIIHDITDRKEVEKSLLAYAHALQRSNQELDDFAYIVSHDLKEPLRGLQSFSQFLLEDYADKLDDEGKRKLRTMVDLSKRLETLLDNLLYYSRLGRTEMAVLQTDLNDVIQDILGMLSISLKEKNVVVEIIQPLPTVQCDRVRIGEVFQNLITNAIKYCDKGCNRVQIGYVTDHPRAPGENVFYIRDQGIGINEKDMDAIFKIFKRLHPRDAYGGGTGSGLAICKKIITQHGGEIWAESLGEGKGATFFFTIPQQKSKPLTLPF